MATFCLIHSSVQGPQSWSLVVDALEEHGHRAITPDLGEVAPEAEASVFADAAAETIVREIASDESDLWLLAHSASGLFLPWISDRIAELPVRGLVYLAAYVPLADESLLGSLAGDPGMFDPAWIGADPMDDDVARHFLFHDCPEPVLDWALTTRRLMIARTAMAEVVPSALTPFPQAQYILCRDDRTLSPAWMRKAARERLGVEPIEIEGGHCPQVARPCDLANVLAELAATPQ